MLITDIYNVISNERYEITDIGVLNTSYIYRNTIICSSYKIYSRIIVAFVASEYLLSLIDFLAKLI